MDFRLENSVGLGLRHRGWNGQSQYKLRVSFKVIACTVHVLRDVESAQHHNGILSGVAIPCFVARVFRVLDPG